MFYVRGDSYISSFSNPFYLAKKEGTANKEDSLLTETSTTAAVSRYFSSIVDRLFNFIIMAILLSALAYLYTFLLFPLINTTFVPQAANISVPLDIGCPQLAPRASPALNVHDLRPDDIKVVIGLGDSVMAGFAAKGIQTRFLNIKNLYENRGISFALGGDYGATTMPNILNYYSHNLYGPSVGNHVISICFGNQFCPNGQYRDNIDMLNAAQSGARSLNLDHQLSYLFDRLDTEYESGRIHPNDWKLVTLFIGSNDICHSCTEPTSLPYPFGSNIWSTVETLKAKMTNTLVQIIGLMRVQDIVVSTSKYSEYCEPIKFSNFIGHDHECECSHTEANLTIMNNNFPGYNEAIQQVVSKYSEPNDTFAVIYQPLLIDIMSFPIQAISNIDCFHPSALAHAWLSKVLWKMMFVPHSQKNVTAIYDSNAAIYCPTEEDRIQTT